MTNDFDARAMQIAPCNCEKATRQDDPSWGHSIHCVGRLQPAIAAALRECSEAAEAALAEARGEIERLIKWRSAWQDITPGGSEFMTVESVRDYARTLKAETVQAKLDRARTLARVRTLEEALAFYANRETWTGAHPAINDDCDGDFVAVPGLCARAALAKAEAK